MAEGRDISDALRDAVERTVQATVDTRGRAQAAADDLAGSVDDIVKGAEKGITARRRSVREAVGKSLPATQEDLRELRIQLDAVLERLDAIEGRLPDKRSTPAKRRPAAKPKAKSGAKAKSATKAKSGAKPKPKPSGGSGSRS